jgi:hypothetical protein
MAASWSVFAATCLLPLRMSIIGSSYEPTSTRAGHALAGPPARVPGWWARHPRECTNSTACCTR